MTALFMLALLLDTSGPAIVCQLEPKENSAREAVWKEHLDRLTVLARQLPAKPDTRLLIPIADV